LIDKIKFHLNYNNLPKIINSWIDSELF